MYPVPPPIPASELRPRRYWYAVAAAIAVVLIGAGVTIGVLRFTKMLGAVDDGPRFGGTGSVTVQLDAGSDKAIWVESRGLSFAPECQITSPGTLHGSGSDTSIGKGTTTWHLLDTIDVPKTGEYQIRCRSEGTRVQYAIGDSVDVGGFVVGLVLAIVLPIVGFLSCVVICLITGLRRSSHRKRLVAQSYGRPY
jgi:hypothetical protein